MSKIYERLIEDLWWKAYKRFIKDLSKIYKWFIMNDLSTTYQRFIKYLSTIYQGFFNYISKVFRRFMNHIITIGLSIKYLSTIDQMNFFNDLSTKDISAKINDWPLIYQRFIQELLDLIFRIPFFYDSWKLGRARWPLLVRRRHRRHGAIVRGQRCPPALGLRWVRLLFMITYNERCHIRVLYLPITGGGIKTILHTTCRVMIVPHDTIFFFQIWP